jgi:hypothetical protein
MELKPVGVLLGGRLKLSHTRTGKVGRDQVPGAD